MPVSNVASDWPRTFLHPRCFCLAFYIHVVSEVRCDIYFLFLYQVVLCKFHTVFLSRRGEVFTCGHGRGGRLGHNNEQSIIVRSCDVLSTYVHTVCCYSLCDNHGYML